VPGIIEIGPIFSINGELSASLEVQADIMAGATYKLPQVTLTFPQSAGKPVAPNIQLSKSPLNVSVNPTATFTGHLEGTLIPRLDFGIKALGGKADATIFFEVTLDAPLDLTLTVQGSASNKAATTENVSGCATLDASVDISAGAEGQIPGVIDKTINYDIFQMQWQLLQKCFGSMPPSQRLRKRKLFSVPKGIICPGPEDTGKMKKVLSA